MRRAVERGEAMLGEDVPNEDIFVIGDTPLDIEAAHAVGARRSRSQRATTTARRCVRRAPTTCSTPWRRSFRWAEAAARGAGRGYYFGGRPRLERLGRSKCTIATSVSSLSGFLPCRWSAARRAGLDVVELVEHIREQLGDLVDALAVELERAPADVCLRMIEAGTGRRGADVVHDPLGLHRQHRSPRLVGSFAHSRSAKYGRMVAR